MSTATQHPTRPAEYRHIAVRPITPACGALIEGVQPDPELADEVIAEIRRAWLEHVVVFIAAGTLGPSALADFGQRFAPVAAYPMLRGLADEPRVVEVKKLPEERHNFGGLWHSDTAYLAAPPVGAMLLAREVPQCGGDTLFANMYLAFETLSPGMREMLQGLRAVNVSGKPEVSQSRAESLARGAAAPALFEAAHPVVRTHPETGRKLLYVNYAHTLRFEGWREEESAGLLRFLFAHQTRPEFTCRYRWRAGDLAFWDNRACQHNPLNDYHGHLRVMHRVSLGAERPQ